MALTMDPQVREPTAWLFAAMAETAPPPVGDVASRRVAIEALQTRSFNSQPMPTGVAVEDFLTRSHDGTELLLRWYHSDEAIHGSAPGSAVCYLHGGGMILSSVSIYDGPVARYVESSGVPFLSVEYRLAPEHPHPTPVEDCYAGLVYLHEHAEELGVDPARIAVMGDSGGGGLAASLAILVRDRQGPPIARQILIYPMLDDRNTVPEPELLANATWTYDDNATGWGALLGDAMGGPDVSPHAAAARLKDASDLPPAFLEIGDLDIFRDETLAYAQLLGRGGVSAELHLHPGVPHAFEMFAPDSDVAQRVMDDRIRILRSL